MYLVYVYLILCLFCGVNEACANQPTANKVHRALCFIAYDIE